MNQVESMKTTVISRARTWVVKLDVRGAPPVHRQYSDHMIVPDRVEISYLRLGHDPVRMATVRVLGAVEGHPPARRLEALFFTNDVMPDWLTGLVKRHSPS
jgi:hypothetical protein